MATNIFKGARRIAYVTAGLWALGFVIAVVTDDRGLRADYVVVSPDLPPEKADEKCGKHDREDWEYRTTSAGTKVRVTLCFRAKSLKNGEMLVPLRTDGNVMEGDQIYSMPVQEYAWRRMREFSLSKADEEFLDSQYWPSRVELTWTAVQWIIGGWVVLWIFSVSVGWVVRGFMDVPRGQDHRRHVSKSGRGKYETGHR